MLEVTDFPSGENEKGWGRLAIVAKGAKREVCARRAGRGQN